MRHRHKGKYLSKTPSGNIIRKKRPIHDLTYNQTKKQDEGAYEDLIADNIAYTEANIDFLKSRLDDIIANFDNRTKTANALELLNMNPQARVLIGDIVRDYDTLTNFFKNPSDAELESIRQRLITIRNSLKY